MLKFFHWIVGPLLVLASSLGSAASGQEVSGQVAANPAKDADQPPRFVIRAVIAGLDASGKLDIFTRPQIMALENQTAIVNVGQRDVMQLNLQVTAKVTPKKKVLMRVVWEVSKVSPELVPLGNGLQGKAVQVQHFEKTITATSGANIVLHEKGSKTVLFLKANIVSGREAAVRILQDKAKQSN